MSMNRLLPGKVDFKPSMDGVSSSQKNITLSFWPGGNLAGSLRNILFATTALTGGLLFTPAPILAQTVIQGGAIETVIGTGGGTQVSPWTPGQLALGNFGDGTLNISAGGTVHALSGVLFGINNNVNGTLYLTGGSLLSIGNTVMILGFSNGAT